LSGAAILLCLVAASPASAVDADAALNVFKTTTDNRGVGLESRDVQGTVNLFQKITPYTGVRFNYLYFEFESENDAGATFFRRNRVPRLELTYNRQRLSALLVAEQSQTDGTADEFDQNSILANISWKPVRGPGFRLGLRDQRNVVDPGVFGRDTHSRYYTAETFYDGTWGGVAYLFRRNELESPTSEYETTQNRHEIRGYARKPFLERRLTLDFTGSASRLDRTTVIGDQVDLAEPIRAARGLYAIDTTPEVGELDNTPGLIDDDLLTPSPPGIEIGASNTFRNVGVDLGIKVQVTRLEISVDAVSSSDLVWEVYRSPDNLIWEQIPGVTSEFDVALLRYTLRFPETTEQYFKAVNVSTNGEPLVRVTEVRALIDVDVAPGEESFDSNFYRADLGLGFQAGRRVTGRAEAGFSTDQDVAAGLVRRDFREQHYGLRMSADLARHLRLAVGYRFADVQNLRQPVLLRTENSLNANLNWAPLPTVDAVLAAGWRDESEEGSLLQSNQSLRLLVGTALRPDLRLTTDLNGVRVDDRVSGYTRQGWTWRELLSMQPTRRWMVGLILRISDFESVTGAESLRQESYGASTSWSATNFLALQGAWYVNYENHLRSFRQNYSLSYNPGPKLSLGAGYQENGTEDIIGTTSSNFRLSYRLNAHFMVFGTYSRSKTSNSGIDTGEVTSLRLGLRLIL
jgi:hypothetical protein